MKELCSHFNFGRTTAPRGTEKCHFACRIVLSTVRSIARVAKRAYLKFVKSIRAKEEERDGRTEPRSRGTKRRTDRPKRMPKWAAERKFTGSGVDRFRIGRETRNRTANGCNVEEI